jgi:hypothetical protein
MDSPRPAADDPAARAYSAALKNLSLPSRRIRIPLGPQSPWDAEDVRIATGSDIAQDERSAYIHSESAENPQHTVHFGLAFHSRKSSHAMVVLRILDAPADVADPDTINKVKSHVPVEPQRNFSIAHAPVRIIDIRNSSDGWNLILDFNIEHEGCSFSRYVDLYRLRVCERVWKHWAIISCPDSDYKVRVVI